MFKIRKSNTLHYVLKGVFLVGAILTAFEINIYRDTIINWVIPTSIWFVTGLLLTLLTSRILELQYGKSSFFIHLAYNVLAFGGMLIYIFMASNYYFPTDEKIVKKVKIIKIGYLGKGRYGCGNPYVNVRINGIDKELIFPCDTEIENHNFVSLTIRKGLLGFDVIIEKTLTIK